MQFNTGLLHNKAVVPYADASTIPHISQAVEYQFETAEAAGRAFHHQSPAYAYTRVANPTVSAFERRIAEAEGGLGAYACSSGMAAVTLAILNIVRAGDEIICSSTVYGGTMDLLADLELLGIHTVYSPVMTPEALEPLFTERTKVVFAEMIGNPSLRILDVPAAAQAAHSHGAALIVDATTATPYLARPLALGADIVIHSTTKYISGSGQAVGGVIIDGGKTDWTGKAVSTGCGNGGAEEVPLRFPALAKFRRYGPYAYLFRLRTGLGENFGGCMAPMNAYLTTLGLETLGVRMERICLTTKLLAEALEKTEGVEVNYPTLPSSPDKELAERELGGYGGGILTLRAGTKERAYAIINRLRYSIRATSLGDVRTLAIHPASTFFANTSKEQNAAAGVYEDTIRVSVGLEDAEDLIEDYMTAIRETGHDHSRQQ